MTVSVRPGATSPLNGATFGSGETVCITEVPFTPAFDLRVQPGTPAFEAVCAALGMRLPTTVGTVARKNAVCMGQPGHDANATDGIIAMCLGPDWWLLTGTADPMPLLHDVRQNHHVSLVDVSAQRTKLEFWGQRSVEVLEHVWEQDLRPENFGVDSCTQGLIVKAPVLMWHCCTNCYVLFVRSSFAQHVWEVLTDAAHEYV